MNISDSIWVAALLAGFFGSPHCLGMCGGIVTAFGMSINQQSTSNKIKLIGSYQLGRLLSYAILGCLAGLLGTAAINPLRGSSVPMVLLGLTFLIVGASMLGLKWLNMLERFGLGLWQRMAPLRQKLFPLNTLPRALAAGILWGFLPCGLVYGALLLAFNAGSIINSAWVMFMFGVGTLPMLLLGSSAVQALQRAIGKWQLRRLNAILLIVIGVWMIMSPMRKHHHNHQMPVQPEVTATVEMNQPQPAVVSVSPATQIMDMQHDMSNMTLEEHAKMMQEMGGMSDMTPEEHAKMMHEMGDMSGQSK